MSAHTKAHPIDSARVLCLVTITIPHSKKLSYQIDPLRVKELEKFLKKYAQEDAPEAWEILAKERIERYKKAGLVLRGMRYREGMSQKELAQKSKVSQNEISKIENGKRAVGDKVAKRLAAALNIDYRLLTEG